MKFWIVYIKEIFSIAELSKKTILLIVFFSIFSSFLDLLSIGIIGSLAELVINKKELPELFILLDKLNLFGIYLNNEISPAITAAYLLIFVFFIKFSTTVLIFKFLISLRLELLASLRKKLMSIYQGLEWPKYINLDSSSIINTLTTNSTRYTNVLFSVLKIISEIIILSLILSYIIFYVGFEILLFIFFFIFLAIIYIAIFKKKIIQKNQQIVFSNTKLIQSIKESIAGLKEMKINNRQFLFIDSVAESAKKNIKRNDIRFSY
jgi:ABC-type multidrug transport system fused ATPase/permease subunit